jgi:hypothetical protein
MLRIDRIGMCVRRLLLLLGGFLLSVTLHVDLRAQDTLPGVHPKALSESTRRVVFDSGAFFGPSAAMPQWDNGYLITRAVETFESGVPNVQLYGTSGEKVREAAIWFPGSYRVIIHSATATADGGIIAGGHAEKPDGSAGPFIALINPAGKITNVIQTRGFVPENVCQGPDGTVWSFGGTGYDTNSEPNPGDTLRHFDFQKGKIGSYVPRSVFPKHPTPGMIAYIRCSANEVVAYSTTAREYIEMKYGGDAPHVYHAEVPSDLRLLGFAVTGSKKIYGYFSLLGRGGLYYLLFNEAANTVSWVPIEATVGVYTEPGRITGLWGSDGNNLLVSRAEDRAGEQAIHWVTPLQ